MTALSFRLAQRGCTVVDTVEEADVVVVNTCCVTAGTEAKTKRFLRHVALSAPRAKICITGCLAQQKAEQLVRMDRVEWVVGNGCKNDIAAIINGREKGVFCGPPLQRRLTAELPDAPLFFSVSRRTRFSIKIQEGCDFRCAYCIVPLVRGSSRSAAMEQVHHACRLAIEAGFKEIVLTGTHIGQYRDEGNTLTNLVDKVTGIPGDYRVRISSLDPRDLSEPLLQLITSHPRVCRHVHVSVQSLCQPVVDRMNRSASDVASIVAMLSAVRRQYPTLGIGGDFIVGFPGESDAMFEETVGNVERVGFSYGHVFRYSKRPSTPAAELPGQLDEKEKNHRSALLREALRGCRAGFIRACMGAVHRIIVETENPVVGIASNYLRIEVPGVVCKRNQWSEVLLTHDSDRSGHCLGALSA